MKKINFNPWLVLLAHMLVMWIAINMNVLARFFDSSQYLHAAWENLLNRNFRWPNYIHRINCVLVIVPLIELNYWFVIKKHKLIKGLLITITFVTLYQYISSFIFAHTTPNYAFSLELTPRVARVLFIFTFYAFTYGVIRKLIYLYLKNKTDTIQRYGYELQTLRAQWNPHFFFNSLNYLYGTALEENAPRTSEAVEILSRMMR